ncbi:DUF3768 domain-containing protein [uncultured Litoreibacter sp.]|uniref:DUF3768 domain-containing protein n=1 Tax=uncultured Litoreibacter sp. TaxID=1392394 RepID=UPI00261D8402|nr:DUF3768 domain-containing protein [uncultured Litoreibacter sp.]
MSIQGDVEAIGTVPCCRTCGSERVVKDAWACFNAETGLWELEAVFDDEHCHQCEAETKLAWHKADHPPHKRVRELNDHFRTMGNGHGTVLFTAGVQERGDAFILAAVSAVQSFAEFSEDNDPWGEHDFGAVEVLEEKIFWKIDYYNQDQTAGSENPANEGVTHRVLTIMLASEY